MSASAGSPRASRLAPALALLLLPASLVAAPAGAPWRGADAESSRVVADSTARGAADSPRAVARRDSLARAEAPDTTQAAPLDRYLRGLATDTDRRFGAVAAPIDTNGFGTLLATANFDSLERLQPRRPMQWAPWWRFDRTTGSVLGGGVTFGSPRRLGSLGGRLGRAFASKEWFGVGEIRRHWGPPVGGRRWDLRLGAGREIGTVDPDRSATLLSSIGAASEGADWQSYLRRDGTRLELERQSATLRVRLGARTELESPRATATTWNLLHHPLELEPNLAARGARIRELAGLGTWRLPWSAWWLETDVRQAGRVLGGDLTYTRTRAALASQLGLGHWATLVPQAMLGRLEGDLAPQDAFWLGGSNSLRSIPTDSETGQRKAFGRLELFGAPDLLALAHVPHPPLLDLYAAAQVASGAVWGADPLGGPTRPGHAWPARNGWRSEAGASLMYRPGIPSPDGFVRFDWAHGIGPQSNRQRWSAQFSLPFDQLRPLGR